MQAMFRRLVHQRTLDARILTWDSGCALDNSDHPGSAPVKYRYACILLAALALLAYGCALRGAMQTLRLASDEEAAVLRQEIVAMGFEPIGRADGLLKERGVAYAIAGYAFEGRYADLRSEITIRFYTPPKESGLPPSRNAVIRCWARRDAETTSLQLLKELTQRIRRRGVVTPPPRSDTNSAAP